MGEVGGDRVKAQCNLYLYLADVEFLHCTLSFTMPQLDDQKESSTPNLRVLSEAEADGLLQLKQREQDLEQREIELKKELRKREQDPELIKLKHQLHIEKFKLGAKTVVSLVALIAGLIFHSGGDSIGAFLIGSGLGGFGITMASAPSQSGGEKE